MLSAPPPQICKKKRPSKRIKNTNCTIHHGLAQRELFYFLVCSPPPPSFIYFLMHPVKTYVVIDNESKATDYNMAEKPLAHRGTGGTSLTSEDDAVPDIDTNNVCAEFGHQKLPD